MTVGENIKRIRKKKGLTQKQLGALCGLADSAIRRYELGGANPKIETIQKIARALEVEYTDLFTFKKYEITTDLLANQPDIKKHIIDSTLNIMGNDMNQQVKEILTNGSIDEIVKILNSIITHIEINEDLDTIKIHYYVNSKKDYLLNAFEKLNETGKTEAIKRVEELAEIPKYQKYFNSTAASLNAAHAVPEASEEDKKHDDDIMNDDSQWT